MLEQIIVEFPKPKKLSKRAMLLQELYQLYISQPETLKEENQKRYRYWMGKTHPEAVQRQGFSKERYDSFKDEFRKAKLPKELKYLKYDTEKRFWRHFTHLTGDKGNDALQYMISVARDMGHRYDRARKEDKKKYIISKFILGSIKFSPTTVDVAE